MVRLCAVKAEWREAMRWRSGPKQGEGVVFRCIAPATQGKASCWQRGAKLSFGTVMLCWGLAELSTAAVLPSTA